MHMGILENVLDSEDEITLNSPIESKIYYAQDSQTFDK